MNRYSLAPLAALLIAASTTAAFAHAELKTSMPEKNATLKTAPADVMIEFSEELNPTLSKIVVEDAKGQHVDKGDSHVDAGDPKHMMVDLNTLAAGTYKVTWTSVAADDGHKLSGSFKFTVAP
ncbi:MAG TPA: copper resistance protein CopC [Dongiaceae bacterium]|nr:copper resistance protein CopC [Dongiaceae bacterium]